MKVSTVLRYGSSITIRPVLKGRICAQGYQGNIPEREVSIYFKVFSIYFFEALLDMKFREAKKLYSFRAVILKV
jgi:hypothetical protein